MPEGKKTQVEEPTPIEEKSGLDWFLSKNLFVLPFGNGGRGTPVKLFPIVFMVVFVSGLLIFDKFFAG